MLKDIDHVQLAMPAGEEARARDFYAGVLGLREIAKPPHLARRGGLWFNLGARQLHLGVERDFTPAKKAHPAFLVDDMAELRHALEANGTPVVDDAPLEGAERCYAEDPFGNRLEFLAARWSFMLIKYYVPVIPVADVQAQRWVVDRDEGGLMVDCRRGGGVGHGVAMAEDREQAEHAEADSAPNSPIQHPSLD